MENMKITKAELKDFRKDFTEVIKPLEKKYNLTTELGGISYDANSFTVKLSAVRGSKEEAEKSEFEKYAEDFSYFGITKDMYLQEFTAVNGNKYVLCGLNPKARKNFLTVRDKKTGKQYVCAPDFLGIKGATYKAEVTHA